MACKTFVLLMALLFVAGWPATVRAQGGGQPALSATGAATVQQKPTRMRMCVQLFGKAKTLEEAMVKLKERREAAVLQLESLKADKHSVVFDGPTMSSAQAAQKRQIEALVLEQIRARGRKPKGLQVPQTVTVTGSLTAEWPLEAKSQEQLLLLAQGIEEKIRAADLSGSQEVQKLSPEEEELAEEAKQAMGHDGEQTPALGQPTFLFVAVLSKQDRQKAMAEAFTKAAAEAADLTKAAGVGLGPLIGLSGGCTAQRNYGEEEYNPYGARTMFAEARRMAEQSGGDAGDKPTEAVSNSPSPLSFTCYVSAIFALRK